MSNTKTAVKTQINSIRRKITKSLSNTFFNTENTANLDHIEAASIKKVIVIRPNHRLGNQLLVTPLVQEINNMFPYAEIDLLVKGTVALPIFERYDNVKNIIIQPKKPFNDFWQYLASWGKIKKEKYDLAINVTESSSSGKIATNLTRARIKYYKKNPTRKLLSESHHAATKIIYELRDFLSPLHIPTIGTEIPTLNLLLTQAELDKGKAILQEMVNTDQKTIALFTNATGRKCYTEDWWESFYQKLKTAFPNENIVEVLPVENISKINFQAQSFYSKDIREITAFIANTNIFIGADSGIMHLATASQTPTIGLFSVTNPEVYAPYGNHSKAIHTDKNSQEDIVNSIREIINQV
jgi:ADP-heptose:LPS heptosyltransferase